MRDEHVPLWLDARVVVQCAERQAVEGRLEIEAAKQRRPADTAKSAVRTGRRFIEGDKFCALRPAKVTCFDTCATAKCCAVRLAAHRAMTVEGATERAGDLISHSSAKATASNHRSSLVASYPAVGLQTASFVGRATGRWRQLPYVRFCLQAKGPADGKAKVAARAGESRWRAGRRGRREGRRSRPRGARGAACRWACRAR